MSQQLNAIPPAGLRRMALVLAPLGAVLLIVGLLTLSLDGAGWKLAGAFVGLTALVLLGLAWGLRRAAGLADAEAAERQLDQVLAAAAVGASAGLCGATGQACGSVRRRGRLRRTLSDPHPLSRTSAQQRSGSQSRVRLPVDR